MASKGFTPTLTNGDIAVPAAPNDYAVRVDEEVRALRAGAGGTARVRVVATSNVALASGLENGDTIDGVSLVTGDLVLLSAQSTASQCGIYAVAASGAASRALGFEAYNTYCGLLVVVQEGTANADTIWRGTSNRGGTIDSTALVFDKIIPVANPTESFTIPVGDETTAITTGTAKVTWRMPYAFTVTAVRASVNTVSSSGLPTFDINEGGVSILSTKLSIDASEKTSVTAATPAVISDADLADDAEMTIDIDTAGTGAKGAKIVIIGHRS